MQVDFYQLTRDPAEKVVPALAQRVLDDRGRLLVVSGEEEQLSLISAALWSAKPERFLAHAKVGEGEDALQPILLTNSTASLNHASFIAIVDGQWRDDAMGFDRVFYLFPPSQIDNARAAWRALGERDGVERRYWKQDGGKWVQGP
jgi:DNA polymerase-3 subunit chi